jgi:hypothetical protein
VAGSTRPVSGVPVAQDGVTNDQGRTSRPRPHEVLHRTPGRGRKDTDCPGAMGGHDRTSPSSPAREVRRVGPFQHDAQQVLDTVEESGRRPPSAWTNRTAGLWPSWMCSSSRTTGRIFSVARVCSQRTKCQRTVRQGEKSAGSCHRARPLRTTYKIASAIAVPTFLR